MEIIEITISEIIILIEEIIKITLIIINLIIK
jgi:hypothetical protein